MEVLSIYFIVFLTILLVFGLIKRQENPFRNKWFWIAQFIVAIGITIGIIYFFLLAFGGRRVKDIEGYNRLYYPNGKKQIEYFVKDGLWNGYKREWDSTGILIQKEKYYNGELQDTSLYYFKNSNVERLDINSKGELRTSFLYYENGKLRTEMYFGRVSRDYYQSGVLSHEQKLKGWMIEGEEKYYYENGKIKISGKVKENGEDGIWYYYDSINGQKRDSDKFDYKKHKEFKPNWK